MSTKIEQQFMKELAKTDRALYPKILEVLRAIRARRRKHQARTKGGKK